MFERRAYMLDASRDRVPTQQTLEWLVGVLAQLGFNEPQLYVEAVARGMEVLAEARERFSQSIGGPRGPIVAALLRR